jgi:hypothetical protein
MLEDNAGAINQFVLYLPSLGSWMPEATKNKRISKYFDGCSIYVPYISLENTDEIEHLERSYNSKRIEQRTDVS